MRIVFWGKGARGVACLERLIEYEEVERMGNGR